MATENGAPEVTKADLATENLPTKLREYADYRATPDDLSRCVWQAADQIEWLSRGREEHEALVVKLAARLEEAWQEGAAESEELTTLRAENERLSRLVDLVFEYDSNLIDALERRAARAALTKE